MAKIRLRLLIPALLLLDSSWLTPRLAIPQNKHKSKQMAASYKIRPPPLVNRMISRGAYHQPFSAFFFTAVW